jgi:hypothetical protein
MSRQKKGCAVAIADGHPKLFVETRSQGRLIDQLNLVLDTSTKRRFEDWQLLAPFLTEGSKPHIYVTTTKSNVITNPQYGKTEDGGSGGRERN